MLLGAFNAPLATCGFLSRWKVARLVLISKGKGDLMAPCLVVAGKLLEKLIKPRLTGPICAAGDYSPTQYGFRAGRSTIDAIEKVPKRQKWLMHAVVTVGEWCSL